MDEQRVSNLEEMDEQQARHFLAELLPKLSPQEEYELRHEDYVMEMPQSGERIRGAHPRPGEDAGVPRGLPQPTHHGATPGTREE